VNDVDYWWHYCPAISFRSLGEPHPDVRLKKGEACPLCQKREESP